MQVIRTGTTSTTTSLYMITIMFISTDPRDVQKSTGRQAARETISDNAWVMTWQSRAWFLPNNDHTVPTKSTVRRSRNNESYFKLHFRVLLTNQGLRAGERKFHPTMQLLRHPRKWMSCFTPGTVIEPRLLGRPIRKRSFHTSYAIPAPLRGL